MSFNPAVFLIVLSTDPGGELEVVEELPDEYKERHCDSLIMCIVTTLNEGLRNGGGIGDVLRKPSSTVSSGIHLYLLMAYKDVKLPWKVSGALGNIQNKLTALGLVQNCLNSNASALELLQSCTNEP